MRVKTTIWSSESDVLWKERDIGIGNIWVLSSVLVLHSRKLFVFLQRNTWCADFHVHYSYSDVFEFQWWIPNKDPAETPVTSTVIILCQFDSVMGCPDSWLNNFSGCVFEGDFRRDSWIDSLYKFSVFISSNRVSFLLSLSPHFLEFQVDTH